jgi:hypothetical protein
LTLEAKQLTLNKVDSEFKIPKLLHQTYKDRSKVPSKVHENIKEYASEYEHILYDDKDIEGFLKEHFVPEVLKAFHTLKLGAHKADLFRYCVLYIKGGVYMDIKTRLIKPIAELFKDDAINTVISRVPTEIYQGVVAAPPGKAIFLSLISSILQRCENPPYNLFIIDFMRYITWDIEQDPKQGKNEGKRFNYNLLQESCSNKSDQCEDGLDRYSKCCNIFSDKGREIKTRYSDYPW